MLALTYTNLTYRPARRPGQQSAKGIVKITKIEFNHFCKSNSVYMLLYKRSTWWKHWACPNGCRLLNDLRKRHRNSRINKFLPKTSFHALLTFICFCTFFILWLLSPAASSVSRYRFCLVYSGLAYAIYSGGGPSTSAPYVRSVGHVFTYLYTLDYDSECPMDNETSLLPNVSFR